MANPLRSEAAAYRFLLLTIGYFALIVAATLIFGTWAGLAVFVVLSAVVLWRLFQGRRELPAPISAVRPHAEDERRILVVANETVGGQTLCEQIHERSEGVAEHVLVVCAGAQLAAQALGLRRGRRTRRRGRAAEREPRQAPVARRQRGGRGRRRRPAAGDRGRAPHLRRRRDHHLDAPRGPLALARAGRRGRGPPALLAAGHARRGRPRGRARRSPQLNRPTPLRLAGLSSTDAAWRKPLVQRLRATSVPPAAAPPVHVRRRRLAQASWHRTCDGLARRDDEVRDGLDLLFGELVLEGRHDPAAVLDLLIAPPRRSTTRPGSGRR